MAIEPIPVGSFIPNKAGLPNAVAEEVKPATEKVAVAEVGTGDQGASAQDSDTPSGGDANPGHVNVKA